MVFDYGGTITFGARTAPSRPVDPFAAAALHVLHRLGLRLLLASNTLEMQDRRPALKIAGVDHLFYEVFQSHLMGIAKPDPEFYRRVLTAAQGTPGQVLWVGNSLKKDVVEPACHGIRTALVRPEGLHQGERLPNGAILIAQIGVLPRLLTEQEK
ncbi:HAD family hydrolase [Spongiactinospora sp. TRM90649]|uniref:HAD family hydrolase n=1 Tax=Spongiactinospora sp. TRM90649 TaxID=3031114 RepID=UPI0023F779CE|nr:HAD family hydrolase [Spongiactinospora sp. TRM90649]MDF5756572.1 HAD family hydrolase [Spongiactinospora sp. TRM90649]